MARKSQVTPPMQCFTSPMLDFAGLFSLSVNYLHKMCLLSTLMVVSLLSCLFVSSASRVSSFRARHGHSPLPSGLSANTALCLSGWNLYPDTSASVNLSSDE